MNDADVNALVQATRAVVLEREAALLQRIDAASSAKAAAGRVNTDRLADEVVVAIDGLLRRTLAPLVKRIEGLERSPPFSYEGPHEVGKSYTRGQFVSHNGSLWHCESNGVAHKPGDGPGWRLAVKAGRDAR